MQSVFLLRLQPPDAPGGRTGICRAVQRRLQHGCSVGLAYRALLVTGRKLLHVSPAIRMTWHMLRGKLPSPRDRVNRRVIRILFLVLTSCWHSSANVLPLCRMWGGCQALQCTPIRLCHCYCGSRSAVTAAVA